MIGHYSNIEKFRRAKGYTTQQVADLSGLRLATYLKMERGERPCFLDDAEKIAPVLGGEPADFNPAIPRQAVILKLVQP